MDYQIAAPPDRTMRRHVVGPGAVISALLVAWPSVARADDLSALVYLLVVWPLALLFLIGIVVMIIIAGVKLGRKVIGPPAWRAGCWITGISVGLIVVHTLVTVAAHQTVRTRTFGVLVVSLLPVLVPGLVSAGLGWLLLRRRSSGPPAPGGSSSADPPG